MVKTDFIALSFAKSKLQLVELDGAKKKVVRYITIDLPAGLISNNKITDSGKMADFLRALWKKLNLKKIEVGIVVPEFSTFIKSLTIPKIDKSELEEAVMWQAGDSLPKNLANLSFDWRIIKEENGNYNIDLVAIDKETLESYVSSITKAGLLPQLVETPSLALGRIAGSNEDGTLVIYSYFDETILLILDGKSLVGSSVESMDKDAIVGTARRILKHYNSVNFKKLLVGGITLNKEIVSQVSIDLKLTPEILTNSIAGISKEELQSYLVPISLHFASVEDPADAKTINLIPKEEIAKYQSKHQNDRSWILTLFATFSIWVMLLSVLGTYIYLNQNIKTLGSKNTAKINVVKDTQEDRDTIKNINSVAQKVTTTLSYANSPHAIINPISETLPGGITISKWDIDLDLGTVLIEGSAIDRDSLISLKRNLEKNADFAQINLPISSFESDTNIVFELSFIYVPSLRSKTAKK